MRKAFTLLELMVVIAIIALMLGVGVASIAAGQGAARVKGATRDVYAAIRHARSIALVTGQRVLVTYSNETVDGEPVAKVDVVSAKIMNTAARDTVVQPYYVMDYKELPQKKPVQGKRMELVHIRKAQPKGSPSETEEADDSAGETVEEILFAPMSESVVRGMRLKAVKSDEEDGDETDVQRGHRISVSSNVDWLLKLYKDTKDGGAALTEKETGKGEPSPAAGGSDSPDDMQEPVSVIWQTNGAVEPHKVWIYADGRKPEEGLLLSIDRFGAVKVLGGDGKENE